MSDFLKNIIIVLLIFVLISSIYSFFAGQQLFEEKELIDLSQLVAEINEEKIKEITIFDSSLEIELKDGKKQEVQKERETSLTESLKNFGLDPQKLQNIKLEVKKQGGFMFWFGVLAPFIAPLLIIGLFFFWLARSAQKGASQAFGFTRSLARIIKPEEKKGEKKVTFKDVAGLKEAKEELEEVVEFLKNPKKFTGLGAKIPKGVLLVGPPGTGKTLLARAVANEAHVLFFHMAGSEFVELFVGVGASRVRHTFQSAKKAAPSILFIDELDAIGRHRGAGLGGGHDEREQTLNQILVEMDGFEPNSGLIMIAATNRPDILDPALLRPGRFDRRIILDLPDINDREEILKIHGQDKPLSLNVNLRQIAERTPGFSGADLANLMNEAAILAARRNKKQISQEELISSVEKVLLGPERKSHILSQKEKEIAAYHEAGHALVGASLPNCDPVRKVSIVARGLAAGYTLKLPTEDKYLHSRSEFIDELSMLLGGYSAEKIIFNEITTGAANDLEQSSKLARKLVMQFGMSEKLGPLTFGERQELIFLGREIAEQRNYSEKIAGQIDQEVSSLISSAHKTALKILTEKKEQLIRIAQRLIKKETIEKEEFEELLK